MGAYKHWVNCKEPGVTLFITTTVLDFVHAFHRPEIRDEMVLQIARECRLARAALYGYVVMPHHIHLVARMHEKMNGPDFMRVFKRRTGDGIRKLLSETELRQFDQQIGLNGNTFWKYSFRSVVIENEDMFWQKMEYTHYNPVVAGYSESPELYPWSSAQLVVAGHLSMDAGLPYDDVVQSVGRGI